MQSNKTSQGHLLKFIYSEKATKFCEIFPLLLTGTTWDKSKGKILQNFVAFSEYMNFKILGLIGLAKKWRLITTYHLRKWQNVNWVRKLSYVSWINQQLQLIKTRYGSKMHSMYNLFDWIYHFSSQFSFLFFNEISRVLITCFHEFVLKFCFTS